ncbi:MAG TPA: SHOCT domain-containing protein [Vicinamibacterales bacterium]|nr:SHOCT domain-containing protein [Vicinamibacterales bacterium]
MMRRRRPLVRAAVVGGAAYHVGKKTQQGRQAEADQDAQIAELQQQQAAQQQAPPPAPAQAAPAAGGGLADELAKLKSLLDSGVLNQAEFDAAKQRIIAGG